MEEKVTFVDYFKDYHPIVNFLFFLSVIIFSFSTNNPYLQLISFFGCFLYSIYLKGYKATKFNILYMGLSFLFISIINPLVNHQGVTIITYLWDGNPLTLESILYGMSSGFMLITVIIWFSCYNEVMTSDKFIYIFGRIIPASSLIFSMVLRFVPLYKKQIKSIETSQRAIGRGIKGVKGFAKFRNSLTIFSIFVTWALENSIETADSMKARGYGLKGRTAFSIFKFTKRDVVALLGIIIINLFLAYLHFKGAYRVTYYPTIKIAIFNFKSTVGIVLYIALCAIPLLINIGEEIRWKYYR